MFTIRSYYAIPLLAIGLMCLPLPLPAQFPTVQPLNSLEGGSGSRLGVALHDIDADRAVVLKLGAVNGVEVKGVEPGSPAEQAGIKTGDVLLSYNNESIVGAQQLGRMVGETPVGRKVKIEYFRDGKVTTVTAITAAARQTSVLTLPEPPNFGRTFGGAIDLWQPGSFPTARFLWTNPRLGIESEGLDAHESQLAEFFGVKHGVLVRAVSKDSPAAKAGLRAGDVLTQIGDHAVADPKDIASFLRQEQHLTKPFSVEVTREHKPFTFKVNLAPEPQE
jgi:serine protease Do